MTKVKNVTPAVRYKPQERIYLLEILKGLALTFRHLLRNLVTYRTDRQTIVTIQYPDERRTYSPRFRGRHRLKKNPDGSMRCVACKLCEGNCPSRCIHIEPAAYPDPSKGNYPAKYEIDILRCIFCGYCVEACPKDAIEMTQVSEMGTRSRTVYIRDFLLSAEEQTR